MAIALRISLIVAAIFLVVFVVLNVRRSKMRIEDSMFWVALSLLILLLSLFPQIGTWFSKLFGFLAPVNFIFLFFIFILLMKTFAMSGQISHLESKIKELSQQIAIDNLEHYERTHSTQQRSKTHTHSNDSQ